MIDNSVLVPKRAIFNVLGSLCQEPKLLFLEDMELSPNDFEEKFYKSIYSAINNIIVSNPEIKGITAVDIDNYLASSETIYRTFTENDGFNFMLSAIENANTDLYEQNYLWIKKFSLLREFNKREFGIESLYNPLNPDMEETNKQIENLRTISLEDIVKHFTLKLLNITNSWSISSSHKSYVINEGIDDLLDNLNDEPVYGYSFANQYYNAIFRGMQFGKVLCRSAGTGGNKTRTALSDMVMVACEEFFDLKTMKYIPIGPSMPCTFISTEIDLKQIQITLLAIVSGISEDVIKDGKFSEEVYLRLQKGIEIIKKSPIYLHYLPEYDIQDVSQIIEKDVLQHGVKFVWHDYIMYNPKLAKSTSSEYGSTNMREDLVLVDFSAKLKKLAEKFDVFISTSTQLNRSAKDHEMRDTSAIRGSSAIIDKVDMASLMFRATEKDLKKLEHVTRMPGMRKPNFCHYIFKNREGENNIIVWTIRNMGNMREEMCFCTTMDYEYLSHIQPLDLTVGKIEQQKTAQDVANTIFN